MNRTKSKLAYEEAIQYIPGGVNSPVRALRSVGEHPLFIERARGIRLRDIDGNTFIDFCLSWGVFVLGHSHPYVNKAVRKAVSMGSSYGIPSLQETILAKKIHDCMPSMEKVRFVNSGTEAVMSAIRLARGYTKRNLIVKFEGCYHGHADHLLVSAGSGVATLGGATSAGIPDGFIQYTVCLPFNDREAVERLFKEKGNEIAAIIVEPVPANMGVVPADDSFLRYLRKVTKMYGALLIFDEVITGFRLSLGGAQQLFDIHPDLTTVGKIIGGGFPAAAFGGRSEIMSLLAPDGPVYQAGTLSGNPVAMSAGIATLERLSADGFYENLNKKSTRFLDNLEEAIAGKKITLQRVGSMFTLFFTEGEIRTFEDVQRADLNRFARFFRYMLSNGIYLSPFQFETNFISVAHTDKDLDRVVRLVRNFR